MKPRLVLGGEVDVMGTELCWSINEREKIMIRLFCILVLVASVAGCVTAQQPYDGYGGPGYPPSTSIGIGVGGGSFGGGGLGGGVGVGVGF
jgi:hypothetical protein